MRPLSRTARMLAVYCLAACLLIASLVMLLAKPEPEELEPFPLAIEEMSIAGDADNKNLTVSLLIRNRTDVSKLVYAEYSVALLDEFGSVIVSKDGESAIVFRELLEDGIYTSTKDAKAELKFYLWSHYDEDAYREAFLVRVWPSKTVDDAGEVWTDEKGVGALTGTNSGRKEYSFTDATVAAPVVTEFASAFGVYLEQEGESSGTYQFFELPEEYCVLRYESMDIKLFYASSEDILSRRFQLAFYSSMPDPDNFDRTDALKRSSNKAEQYILAIAELLNSGWTEQELKKGFDEINIEKRTGFYSNYESEVLLLLRAKGLVYIDDESGEVNDALIWGVGTSHSESALDEMLIIDIPD
jgi:hypothetical protein